MSPHIARFLRTSMPGFKVVVRAKATATGPERVEAAIAAQAQFRQQYDEARGTFRRAVGIEPHNLRAPGRLGGLPSSKDQALAVALRGNPTIQAAQADRDAAKHGFDATAGAFRPRLTLKDVRSGAETPQRHSANAPITLRTW